MLHSLPIRTLGSRPGYRLHPVSHRVLLRSSATEAISRASRDLPRLRSDRRPAAGVCKKAVATPVFAGLRPSKTSCTPIVASGVATAFHASLNPSVAEATV